MPLPQGLKTGCTTAGGMAARQAEAREANAALPKPRRNKYNAIKVKQDGHTFDSKAEHARYCELLLLHRAGEIYDLVVHPEFLVFPGRQDGFKVQRSMVYTADFVYRTGGPGEGHASVVVEDVKGHPTRDWKLKWRRVQEMYPGYEWRVVRAK